MELAIVPALRHSFRPEGTPDPLRDRLAAHIERTAAEMLDPERILALAEDMGVVSRKRVHHAGLIIDSLVLSALQRSTDTEGRWLDAQRTYEAVGGARSGKTSFRNQVRKLLPVMQTLLQRRLTALAARGADKGLSGRLQQFGDVLIPDGCAFKVANALSGVYAGTGNAAELKLHAIYSVGAGGVVSVESSAGAMHDSDGFHPQWEPDALYIWDLGYNNYDRIVEAVHAGAHVLQRLKSGANPIVTASYGPTGTVRTLRHDDGRPMQLEEACAFGYVHHQRVLDLDVQIEASNGTSATLRVVCVPFGGEDRYYLTSLPRTIFTPHDVAELYRVRWEVERFFRGWRGALRLDEVRWLRHPQSLAVAITASLLAAALAHDMTNAVNDLSEEQPDAAARTPAAFPPSARAVGRRRGTRRRADRGTRRRGARRRGARRRGASRRGASRRGARHGGARR